MSASSSSAASSQPFVFAPVPTPHVAVEARVRDALVDNPRGASFGRLASLGAWFAGRQGQAPPKPLETVRIVVFAGDHGVAERGVSAFMPEASVWQAEEITAGGAPVSALAQRAEASVRLIDVSLNREGSAVRRSSGAIDVEDAMTEEEFLRAVKLGRQLADEQADSACDLVVAGDLGVGNTTVAAAVMGALTFTEPVVGVGRGSGINDEVWKTKVAAVRDAMFRVRGFSSDVPKVLRAVSSPDLVTLTAFIAQCAVRRTPMLIDGTLTAVAAYVAERIAPGTKEWLLAGQVGAEPSQAICLQALGLKPISALDLSTGQAAGGAAVVPLVRSAVELVAAEMNSAAETAEA